MSRLSLSDVVQAQEAMIERQAQQLERLTAMHAETLHALTESRRQTPAETFTIKRASVGEKVDVFETNLVRQEGEGRAAMIEEGQALHEKLAMRYPLSDGRTHVWPLDQGDDSKPKSLTERLEGSVKK